MLTTRYSKVSVNLSLELNLFSSREPLCFLISLPGSSDFLPFVFSFSLSLNSFSSCYPTGGAKCIKGCWVPWSELLFLCLPLVFCLPSLPRQGLLGIGKCTGGGGGHASHLVSEQRTGASLPVRIQEEAPLWGSDPQHTEQTFPKCSGSQWY